jgi:hypothetical protein
MHYLHYTIIREKGDPEAIHIIHIARLSERRAAPRAYVRSFAWVYIHTRVRLRLLALACVRLRLRLQALRLRPFAFSGR